MSNIVVLTLDESDLDYLLSLASPGMRATQKLEKALNSIKPKPVHGFYVASFLSNGYPSLYTSPNLYHSNSRANEEMLAYASKQSNVLFLGTFTVKES